jgi:hypothetical protein
VAVRLPRRDVRPEQGNLQAESPARPKGGLRIERDSRGYGAMGPNGRE